MDVSTLLDHLYWLQLYEKTFIIESETYPVFSKGFAWYIVFICLITRSDISPAAIGVSLEIYYFFVEKFLFL